MPQQLLTIKQAAEILQIHPKTAYTWTYLGKLPSIKFNGIVRIPRDKLDELLESKTLFKEAP